MKVRSELLEPRPGESHTVILPEAPPLVFDYDRPVILALEATPGLPLKHWHTRVTGLAAAWSGAQIEIDGSGDVLGRLEKRKAVAAKRMASGEGIEGESLPSPEVVEQDSEQVKQVAIEAQGLIGEQTADLVVEWFPTLISAVDKWAQKKLAAEAELCSSVGIPCTSESSMLHKPLTGVIERLHNRLRHAQGPKPHRYDPRTVFSFLLIAKPATGTVDATLR
jgi:hypothetical protein